MSLCKRWHISATLAAAQEAFWLHAWQEAITDMFSQRLITYYDFEN